MNRYLFTLLILLSSLTVPAQVVINKAESFPVFHVNFAGQLPALTLSERFGENASAGAGYFYKTKSGWLWGADFQYLFGNDVKEDSILDQLRSSNGEILNEYGEYATILLTESGYWVGLKTGKIFPIMKNYPNSGIMVTAGIGFLEHKILIQNQSNNAPQVLGDYKKGYDRLSNGVGTQLFLGYVHVGKKQYANFFAGFEFTQAWTQNRRTINLDTRLQDTSQRIDQLWGFRFGWIIPIYRNVSSDYYY